MSRIGNRWYARDRPRRVLRSPAQILKSSAARDASMIGTEVTGWHRPAEKREAPDPEGTACPECKQDHDGFEYVHGGWDMPEGFIRNYVVITRFPKALKRRTCRRIVKTVGV